MVKELRSLLILLTLLVLGACASRLKDQMVDYRKAFAVSDFKKAKEILEKSDLKKDKKAQLLWYLESGSVSLALEDYDQAIGDFSKSLELIDLLYTKKLTSKAASLLINDASDDFYGASYERSYAHYFLAQAYYARYQKNQNKSDLQSARATILAWDSYFAELQRSASVKTIYQTDLTLKVFGGLVHEVSDIQNDKQIALQLYKDALKILDSLGGAFSIYNEKSSEFIKAWEDALSEGKLPSSKLYSTTDSYQQFKDFLHFKILSITKEIREYDYAVQLKSLNPGPDVLKKLDEGKANVAIVFEEGLIPQKIPKKFNFGIKGAMGAVDNKGAKAFIATVGAEVLTIFAMEKLGMRPSEFDSAGSFIFAHDMTRLAVQEAAIQFELPMIESVPKLSPLKLIISDDKGKIIKEAPFPIVSENGDIAKVVLEEDVVARYVKTGSRIAVKHIVAIVAALQVYQTFKGRGGLNNGDFLAKAAAMATYVGSSKGLTMLEAADVRHWTTLPQGLRMNEFHLPAGNYLVEVASTNAQGESRKKLGNIQVKDSGKTLHTFKQL